MNTQDIVQGDGVADFIVGTSGGVADARVFVSQISAPILGDCNLDGAVTFADIAPFTAILQAGTFLEEANLCFGAAFFIFNLE